MKLPSDLASSNWAPRIEVALAAVRSAGAALVELQGTIQGIEVEGGQLKTGTDLAAEGWVLGMLEGAFPADLFLAEERFEKANIAWPGARAYWTIDALDGTRSYVDGYDGFCVQVAYIEDGEPRLGVIAEPVTRNVYVAAHGCGAWCLNGETAVRLGGSRLAALEPGARFVDSTRPTGSVGALFDRLEGRFVECGSVGLKIVRVVEDVADIYAKAFTYKLWDVAPGEVLVREVGGVLGTFDGTRIDYVGTRIRYSGILVSAASVHAACVAQLANV